MDNLFTVEEMSMSLLFQCKINNRSIKPALDRLKVEKMLSKLQQTLCFVGDSGIEVSI